MSQLKNHLNSAFRLFRKNGIAARQNFTCCSTCGHYDMSQSKKGGAGYVFYHRQDTARLEDDHGTYLSFGIARRHKPEELETLAIQIERLARGAGLITSWNGDTNTRIWVGTREPKG